MATDTDPEGWDEVEELLEAQVRLRDRYYMSIEGKPDAVRGETARWEDQDAGFTERIGKLLDGRPDLQARRQAWHISRGGITEADVERERKRWGRPPADDSRGE